MITIAIGLVLLGPLALGLAGMISPRGTARAPARWDRSLMAVSTLLYTLAFVPPPTGWLLSLPDAPVYLILALALLWTVAALTLPPIHALGRRLFRQRARQYDLRRARRQAHEVGLLAALCVGLAGLRVLTPAPVILLALVLAVAELLFLSFVEPAT